MKLRGLGVVWGSTLDEVGFTALAKVHKSDHSNEQLARRAQRVTLYNGDGKRRTDIAWDEMDVLTLRCYPSGATIAAAKTNLALPQILDEVTVKDETDPDFGTASVTLKKYVVADCSKLKQFNNVCFFDLVLEAPDGVASSYWDNFETV